MESRLRPVLGWLLVIAVAVSLAGALGRPGVAQELDEGELPLGPDLYLANCASCHGDRGQGTYRGPTLIGVGAASADYWLRSGRMPLEEPDEDSDRDEPSFTDLEILVLVEYVATLGDGPPIPELDLGTADLARGGELYRINCAACHNWDGKGGALVNSNNAPVLHPVPPLQVAEAVRIGPGTMPEFAEGQLSDDELNDVVAYVEYLEDPRDAGGYPLAHWGPSTETVAGFFGLSMLVLLAAWAGERRRGR